MVISENCDIKWYVTKYGQIIYDNEFNAPYTNTPFRIKMYRQNDKNYIEVWECGYVIHFSEDFNSQEVIMELITVERNNLDTPEAIEKLSAFNTMQLMANSNMGFEFEDGKLARITFVVEQGQSPLGNVGNVKTKRRRQ